MPHLTTDDGVKLYYEETGKGIPIVFIHEFAGDCRSWEQQVRYFARYYRCITVNARGYPPSDVPKNGVSGVQGSRVRTNSMMPKRPRLRMAPTLGWREASSWWCDRMTASRRAALSIKPSSS